ADCRSPHGALARETLVSPPRSSLAVLRFATACAILGVSFGTLSAQQGTFRSVVDVIAVDVEVVDGDGNPVGALGPRAFDVSIEGHRRKVVSASFIRSVAAPASP